MEVGVVGEAVPRGVDLHHAPVGGEVLQPLGAVEPVEVEHQHAAVAVRWADTPAEGRWEGPGPFS